MKMYIDPDTLIMQIWTADDDLSLRSIRRRRWRCYADIMTDWGVSRSTAYRCLHSCWRLAATRRFYPLRASVYIFRALPALCVRRMYVDSDLVKQWMDHRRPVGNPNFHKQ